MINTITGNLISTIKSGIIVHGCNAQGVMGSGIALQIKNTYPTAFNDYRSHYLQYGLKPGNVVISQVKDGPVICNAVTQEFYGRDGRKYVSEEGVKQAFESISSYALWNNILEVHFPLIGCGLGGGKWEEIGAIIDEALDDSITKTLWVL